MHGMKLIINAKVPIILALIVLVSNPVWFLWNIRFVIVLLLILLLVLFLLPRLHSKSAVNSMGKNIPIVFLFAAYFLGISTLVGGFQTYLLTSAFILLIYPVITKQERLEALKIITNCLAIIILISGIPWLVNTFIFKLPMWGGTIKYYESKGMENVIENYILFIQVQHDFLVRFYSIFDEPGTLGTLCAFVLYGNRYNFKNRANLVILIGAIFTFSLAFYLLVILGLFIQNLRNVKKLLFAVIGLIIVGSTVLYLLADNETFQTAILGRFSDIEGSIENRELATLDVYYNRFLSTPEGIYGAGRNFLLSNPSLFKGQTYKFFVIEFGIIGSLILLITYL